MAAASLGSATGSRVDSAAKHTMACKLDTRFFRCGFEQGGEFADNILHQNKMQYAMQKDEIVMNTTKKFLSVPGSQAYPLVVTTLGDFCGGLMEKFLLWLYASESEPLPVMTSNSRLSKQGCIICPSSGARGWP